MRLPLLLCCALIAGAACDDEVASGPQKPQAGGSTRDFGGARCGYCAHHQEVAWNDDSVTGYSADQVAASFTGAYTARVKWGGPCEKPCARDGGCYAVTPAPSIVGRETTLYYELARSSRPVVVDICDLENDGGLWSLDAGWEAPDPKSIEQCFYAYMRVPIVMTLRTSDGLLDERVEGTVRVGNPARIHVDAGLTELRGELWSVVPGLNGAGWSTWFPGPSPEFWFGAYKPGDPEFLRLVAASSEGCELPQLERED